MPNWWWPPPTNPSGRLRPSSIDWWACWPERPIRSGRWGRAGRVQNQTPGPLDAPKHWRWTGWQVETWAWHRSEKTRLEKHPNIRVHWKLWKQSVKANVRDGCARSVRRVRDQIAEQTNIHRDLQSFSSAWVRTIGTNQINTCSLWVIGQGDEHSRQLQSWKCRLFIIGPGPSKGHDQS